VEAIIKKTMTGLSDNNQTKQEDISIVGNNIVLLNTGLSLLKIFSIDGSEIPYSIENTREYLLKATIPNILFFVLKDSNNNISTQTIISKQ
jgi:hypothetical protein